MKTISIAVVIAVHNRLEYTRRCLQCLSSAAPKHNLVVFVIDDGSSDGTGQYISTFHPEVRLINGNGSLWFGGATQLGIDVVLRAGNFQYVMTLNNDMFLRPDSISHMLKRADSKTVLGAGYYEEDTGDFSTAGFLWRGSGGLKGVSWLPGWTVKASSAYVQVDAVSTTATLFPVELLTKIRPIDLALHPQNRYDVMLSAAVRDAGGKFYVTSAPMADHIHGALRRIKSCREQTWSEFMVDSFSNSVKVTHIHGILHSTWHSAPSRWSGVLAVMRRGGIFLAQALYVAGNTFFGRLNGRKLLIERKVK